MFAADEVGELARLVVDHDPNTPRTHLLVPDNAGMTSWRFGGRRPS